MNKNFEIFFDLAKRMNKKLSIIPILTGSLGLQMLVDDELNPSDIDIAIPQFLYRLSERWQDLVEFMQSEGYELMDLHERWFKKGDTWIDFGVIDGEVPGDIPSLEVHGNIDATECPIIESNGAIYKLLTLEQYLAVYLSSLEDNYRADESGHKDQKKVDIIKKALNYSK